MTKISIIIPVYNSEKYLSKCLNSLLKQTIPNIEIILIDDNSTDNSLKILTTYKEKYPEIIKVFHNSSNIGAAASRNIGILEAKGDYLGFIDSDDYIGKDYYEKLYLACCENNTEIARANRKIVFHRIDASLIGRSSLSKSNGIIDIEQNPSYISQEYPCVTNKIFNREFLENRLFDEDIKWEDYPYTVPLLTRVNKISTVPVTYYYNMNFSGTTISDTRKIPKNILDIFTASDRIITETIKNTSPNYIKEQIDLVVLINCLQRMRDVLYSNAPLKTKKEMISLLSALITKKYGTWQTNELYQQFKNNKKSYQLRMNFIEDYLIDNSYLSSSEEEITENIQKILKKRTN